jgi:hypothetical protein
MLVGSVSDNGVGECWFSVDGGLPVSGFFLIDMSK